MFESKSTIHPSHNDQVMGIIFTKQRRPSVIYTALSVYVVHSHIPVCMDLRSWHLQSVMFSPSY